VRPLTAVPRRGGLLIAWATAVGLAGLLSWASWPGFMSFDSLEALRQARTAVEGQQYPPFGSYVWRVLDWIWPGPTLMHLVQNVLLLGAFGSVLALLGWPPLLLAAGLVGTLLLPPVLGTMLVVWKDVAVAACFMAGFACLLAVRLGVVRSRLGWIAAGLVAIFCGMAYRFNAASGAWPLLLFAMWIALPDRAPVGRAVQAVLAGTALLLVLFALVWIVNSFRFPSFERLQRNTNMDSVMLFDLIGTSVHADRSFVQGTNGQLVPVEYLRRIYDPRHLNITGMNDSEHRVAPAAQDIRGIWLSTVRDSPRAYFAHRLQVFREYIGLHGHEVFYVTHPSLDANPYGISHTPTVLTARAVAHVWEHRNGWSNRPWLYYAVALGALVVAWALGTAPLEASTILASGMLYLAPMFIITPAADLRYNFWCVWASVAALAIVASRSVASRGIAHSSRQQST
jgi:hypothetical protein